MSSCMKIGSNNNNNNIDANGVAEEKERKKKNKNKKRWKKPTKNWLREGMLQNNKEKYMH